MKQVFNKLVRDKIPENIEENGEYVLTETLDDKEFEYELNKKLIEEANEVINAKTKDDLTEEFADLLEVMLAKAQLKDITLEEILRVREEKRNEKGSFEKRTFLISTVSQKYIDENRGCLLCNNGCCKVFYKEKQGYEDDGHPMGYYCLGYKSVYKRHKK